MTLLSNWKVKNFTTSLIKSWSYQFLSLVDKGIKKFIIASEKKIFCLEGQEGCKVVANILYGLDCTTKACFNV